MTTPPQTPRRRPPKPEPPLLVTMEEAARRLALSRTALYALAAKGQEHGGILTVKVGGRRRVPTAELERIAAGR